MTTKTRKLISEVLKAYKGEKALGDLFQYDAKGREAPATQIVVRKYCALGALMCNVKQVKTIKQADIWQEEFDERQKEFLYKNFKVSKPKVEKNYMMLKSHVKSTGDDGKKLKYPTTVTTSAICRGLAELIYTLNDCTDMTIPEIGEYLEVNYNL